MKEIFLVFVGGGLGSLMRFFVGHGINRFHASSFPWGTWVVNIVACFILGFIVGLADHKQLISPAARLFWAVGFCGGFSTFSTFSIESLDLFQKELTVTAILYILGSVLVCVGAVLLGQVVGKQVG